MPAKLALTILRRGEPRSVGYDLAALVPVTREAMLLVAVFLKALTFALLACHRDSRGMAVCGVWRCNLGRRLTSRPMSL